jgi:hypothetical protein
MQPPQGYGGPPPPSQPGYPPQGYGPPPGYGPPQGPPPPKKKSLGRLLLVIFGWMFGGSMACGVLGTVIENVKASSKPPAASTVGAAVAPETPTASAVAAVSAAASTASPTPSAAPDVPSTKLEQLAQTGVTTDAIEKIVEKNEWAFYAPGTTDCYDPQNKHVNLTVPDTDDEFEAKKLQARRGEIAADAVGKIVVLRGEGEVGATDSVNGCCNVTRSKYDFGRKAWTLTFSASEEGYWPLGATDPVITGKTLTTENYHEVAKLGGKSLTVKGLESDTLYENHSKFTVNVPMAPDVAEQHKDSMHVRVLVVQKFIGLGFHKVCQQDCSTIMGIPACSTLNHGIGKYYRASPVGFEVYVEGAMVAQKQPN